MRYVKVTFKCLHTREVLCLLSYICNLIQDPRAWALTCHAARLYSSSLTGLQKRQSPGEYRGFLLLFAIRRCDRGTDAMHLANTHVVSPKAKTPPVGRVPMIKLCVEVTTLNRLR